MISYVNGELVAIEGNKAVVDVMGMGYGILMPLQSISQLPAIGSRVKLHTYLYVKEDAMQLFGFFNRDDLEVYKLIIGVSGIGPKGGLNILSELSSDDLRFAVASSDAKAISKAPGIGKKTAEKLIIELRDKLHLEDAINHTQRNSSGEEVSGLANANHMDAIQALVSLGYDQTESMQAVRRVEDPEGTLSAEDIIKQALRLIAL